MVSGAESVGVVSPDAGFAPSHDSPDTGGDSVVAEARSAVWVGIHVSAARCLLTYVVAPAAGAFGGILGPVGLLLQVLGTVTAIGGARRLWRLRHRSRYAYCAVAVALTLVTGVALVQHVLAHPGLGLQP